VNTKGASVPIFTGNHGVMMMGGHLGTLFLDLQLFFMIISIKRSSPTVGLMNLQRVICREFSWMNGTPSV
jgi:hypothetical protein